MTSTQTRARDYTWTHFIADRAPMPPRRRSRAPELQDQVQRLLERIRMAVIFGGDKSVAGAVINPTTNPRSWKSYESVAHDIAAALRRLGCREVLVIPEDMRLAERLRSEGVGMAWLNSGGVQGYNAICHAPAMLEMLGIPYVGHTPLTAATLDSKHVFKRHLAAARIPTAPFFVWQPGQGRFRPDATPRFEQEFAGWHDGFVVKPVTGRASLHVHHVFDRDALAEIVAEVQGATQNTVLIEGFLSGREYCVATCGPVVSRHGVLERLEGPLAFACVERVLAPDEQIFTSMDLNPITSDRLRMLGPQDERLRQELQELARDVFVEFGLEALIRLDVRAGKDGRLRVLEANPKPDLKAPSATSTSIICEGLKREGMTYDDLIFCLLADKVDFLFRERRGSANVLLSAAA